MHNAVQSYHSAASRCDLHTVLKVLVLGASCCEASSSFGLCVLLPFDCLYAVGGKPAWLLSPMDGQLEPVRQDIGRVKDKIVKTKQDLAVAEQAVYKDKERILFELLLSLNKHPSGLQENVKHQVSPAFSLYILTNMCFHGLPLCSVNDSIFWVLLLHMIQKGY